MRNAPMKKVLSLICVVALVLSLASCFVSCSSQKKAMEYKGYSISEGMYSYWLNSWKDYYVDYYSDISDTNEYWSAVNSSGVTNERFLTEQIETRIYYYLVAQKLFDDYDLELDKETVDAIESDINDQTEYYGSKSAFNDFLASEYGINISTLRKIYEIEDKYTAVFNYLYGTEGKNTSTPDELDEYYREYYVRVKYVMFFNSVKYKYDENGNKITNPTTGYYEFVDLTEEEKIQAKTDANAVFEAVKGGENIDTYMDKYMKDFGYDKEKTPNGYYISPDNYTAHTADVTSAALEMKVGEVRFIENETCYFVVQKFDLIDKAYSTDPDSLQFSDLVSYSNNLKFSKEFNGYISDIVKYNEITDKYKLSEI